MGKPTVEFPLNVPVELCLRYPEGKIVEGRFGDRVMWGLDFPDEHVMFIDLAVAQKITNLEIRPGEHFFLCKRQKAGQKKAMWDIWLSPITEQMRAQVEMAQMEPPAAPPKPAEDPSMLERQLRASLIEAQARKEPQSAPAAVPAPAANHGPVALPKPAPAAPASAAAPAWVNVLILQTNHMVDVYAACLEHADRYGNRINPEDVRKLMTTAFINLAGKQGKSNAA
jgi:hypothetical protein